MECPLRYRTVLGGKIHRARITSADLHYVGSITIDEDLLDAAGILPHERVQVVDIDNGARLETYVLTGTRGSGVIQMNGAAARLVHVGDVIIIMSYLLMDDDEAAAHEPKVCIIDPDTNTIIGHAHSPEDLHPEEG